MTTVATTTSSRIAKRAPDLTTPRVSQRLTVGLAALFIVLTFTLSSPLLELFIHYTSSGGTLLHKFHPASYVAAVLLVLGLSRSDSFRFPALHFVICAALLAFLIVWLVLHGKMGLGAIVLDVQLAPTILLLALSKLSFENLRRLVALFVWIAAANALLVLVEFAAGFTILPVIQSADYFRPAGLSGHPIVAGTVFYCAIFAVANGAVSDRWSRPLLALFFLAVAACGVRGPLAMAALIVVAYLLWRPSKKRGTWLHREDIGFLALLLTVVVIASAVGGFDRVLEIGLWDESARSRFEIFGAFNLLSPYQFWYGIDGYEVGAYLATQVTGSRLIESSFVSVVLQAGMPVALALAGCVLLVHLPALKSSPLFFLMFLVVSVTTIGFSVKGPISGAMALVGYFCFARVRQLSVTVERG